MLYQFAPLYAGQQVPFMGIVRPGVYDIDPDVVRKSGVLVRIPGIDGNPCFVPVTPTPLSPIPTAASDFIAAISAPTAMNPETDPETEHPEADNDAAPARRGRGRPKKSGK